MVPNGVKASAASLIASGDGDIVINLIQQERKIVTFGNPSRPTQRNNHSLDCFLRRLLAVITDDFERLGIIVFKKVSGNA